MKFLKTEKIDGKLYALYETLDVTDYYDLTVKVIKVPVEEEKGEDFEERREELRVLRDQLKKAEDVSPFNPKGDARSDGHAGD